MTVPGFYDEVVELSPADRKLLARAPFNLKEYKEFLDVRELRGERGYTPLERVGIRPCLDVCGIWGGYTGAGAKTVLPSEAHAKRERLHHGNHVPKLVVGNPLLLVDDGIALPAPPPIPRLRSLRFSVRRCGPA